MPDILNNCIITHENSEILKYYGVTSSGTSYHTGVDIEGTNIYCPCKGVCIFNGLIENKPSCTVQYSNNICLRFTHLKEVNVNEGQLVEYDSIIGIADKYVHFEYLTSENTYPHFRVFFNAQNSYFMYKHDPMLVLSGNTGFDNHPVASTNDDMDARYSAYLALKEQDSNFFDGNDQFAFLNSDLFDDLRC